MVIWWCTHRGREGVNRFLRHLQVTLGEKNTSEVHNLYEHDFNKISEKHFQESNWPSPEAVASVVDEGTLSSLFPLPHALLHKSFLSVFLMKFCPHIDPLFGLLYRELYYRHFYAKCSDRLTLEERRLSWETYSQLFSTIIGG